MNEFVEKLIKRFKSEQNCADWIAVYDVISIINQLAEEYNNGWILLSERLPEDGQNIIFTNECGIVETGYYEAKKNWCVNDSYFPNAFYFTAWQPLPEPYQIGGVQNDNI